MRLQNMRSHHDHLHDLLQVHLVPSTEDEEVSVDLHDNVSRGGLVESRLGVCLLTVCPTESCNSHACRETED